MKKSQTSPAEQERAAKATGNSPFLEREQKKRPQLGHRQCLHGILGTELSLVYIVEVSHALLRHTGGAGGRRQDFHSPRHYSRVDFGRSYEEELYALEVQNCIACMLYVFN